MENRGSKAEAALIKSGLNKGHVAERLQIDRRTLYNKLKRPDLEYDFIIELYKVIRFDVTEDFPELTKFVFDKEGDHELEDSKDVREELEKCKREIEDLKEKYLQILEENALLSRLNRELSKKQEQRY